MSFVKKIDLRLENFINNYERAERASQNFCIFASNHIILVKIISCKTKVDATCTSVRNIHDIASPIKRVET